MGKEHALIRYGTQSLNGSKHSHSVLSCEMPESLIWVYFGMSKWEPNLCALLRVLHMAHPEKATN